MTNCTNLKVAGKTQDSIPESLSPLKRVVIIAATIGTVVTIGGVLASIFESKATALFDDLDSVDVDPSITEMI